MLETTIPERFNKLVGTPPYNISSKLVLFMIRTDFDLGSIVFQKEFGERLLARPGTRDYGRLSVTTQRVLEVEPVSFVPRSAFNPRPKVDSMLLRIKRKEFATIKTPDTIFESLVRGLFTQRRRLARSSLRHWLRETLGKRDGDRVMTGMVLPDVRVYQLTLPQIEALSLELSETLEKESLTIPET